MEISRRQLGKALQYGIGLATLAWLLSSADWDHVRQLLVGIEPPIVVLLVVVSIGETVCRFSMWSVLCNAIEPTPFSTAIRTTLITNYINQLLPSRLSGRSAAPVVLRHFTGHDWSTVTSITGVHTALYAVCNGFVALAGLIWFLDAFSPGLLIVLAGSIGLYLVVGVGSLLAGWRFDALVALCAPLSSVASRIGPIDRLLNRLSTQVPAFSNGVTATFTVLLGNPVVVARYVGGWVGSRMVFPALRVWLLLSVFGEPFSPIALSVVLVTAYSVTLLPLTPGGIGVAEASATLVFVALGVPQGVIAPVIVADRFLGVYLPSLAGWIPLSRLNLSAILNDASQ